MGFSDDLRAFYKGQEERADAVVRGALITLTTKIILRSPVDTGMFRGNWQITQGSPPAYPVNTPDKVGSVTIDRAKEAIPHDAAGLVYYIANNVHYGIYLERGHSAQAPPHAAGSVVGLSVLEFQTVVNRIVSELPR